MRIRYQPKNGALNVTVPFFADGPTHDAEGNPTGSEYRNWYAGQERDVPDDLRVRFNVSNNAFGVRFGKVEAQGQPGAVRTVRAVDALLSVGPIFVDADSGVNPDFVCSECGEETTELYFHDPNLLPMGAEVNADRGPDTRVWYSTDGTVNGEKLCMRDFLARFPQYIDWHVSFGAPKTITHEARNRANDARIKAEQAKQQRPPQPAAPAPAVPKESDHNA